jgi:dephospho-CoA kinase
VTTATTPNDTNLPEIITAWLPRYVGLHGFAGVGKDTIAAILTEEYGYERIAFADKLREALYVLNPVILTDRGGEYVRVQELVDSLGWDKAKRSFEEIRRMLQVLGTEIGREMISQNVWVDATFKGLDKNKRYVFTDVRFENEHHAIDQHLGLLIKVERPGVGPANDHKSEKPLPDKWFDAYIDNNGTVNDLHTKVREVLARA